MPATRRSTRAASPATPRGRSTSRSGSPSRSSRKALKLDSETPSPAAKPKGPRSAMTGDAVKKDEGKRQKILTRVFFGVLMVLGFLFVMFAGHVYLCALVALVEVLLFKELVKVRYNAHLETIEKNVPLFRTTQWAWFLVSIYYTYGDFLLELLKNNERTHATAIYWKSSQFHALSSFGLYSAVFVITVVTLRKDFIKFQLNQLCWTVCVLILTVGQLKYIMHNIMNGLFWFVYPILLVVINDVMAYVCGMSFGKKFFPGVFLKLSPNKTWEGFIGGGIFTLIFGWYLAGYLAKFTWMTCPVDTLSIWSPVLDCDVDSNFVGGNLVFPEQIFDLIPNQLVRGLPNVVEFCEVGGTVGPCVSGENGIHDHFELVTKVLPIQLHAIALAIFASLVAPFGGFLASGIKRAYGIKDFDSIIPGHGGIMDRMDCQFLMALCTWVHYNVFVKMGTISVTKLLFLFKVLPADEQRDFIERASEFLINN
ncbi:hypothetical protein TrLO_g10185 [Triparma laevis f. longispina]|uniref:phosphatidate cytidylyltransferase n=1 Tax=Triparma laevis f. longispina TaxID=1714387 RepID=A0A9W7CF67_9STRA|nr:hypothetical protein TrLO_g10185 [Triparma laevis f. longispina]